MRILLIEPDAPTAQLIGLRLKSEGANLTRVASGDHGMELARTYDYDLIVLELHPPDMAGYDVIRALRAGGVKTPILVLSVLANVAATVKALGLGADDYMVKPFHRDELVARIHAVVRRSSGHAESTVQAGDLVVDLVRRSVAVDGARVHLSQKQWQTLELLALRKDRVVSKREIFDHLYGGLDEPDMKIVDVFVHHVRRRIAARSPKTYIETAWGGGYKLRAPPDAAAAAVA